VARNYYGTIYAENTRETFRRQTLRLFLYHFCARDPRWPRKKETDEMRPERDPKTGRFLVGHSSVAIASYQVIAGYQAAPRPRHGTESNPRQLGCCLPGLHAARCSVSRSLSTCTEIVARASPMLPRSWERARCGSRGSSEVFDSLAHRMVGATGIEPVTPTMST
jgi:hypothetical protein